ncbi:7514_t:CDS:2 [Rhizophagus irregularis]|uniref:Uncharacterized protein n=1 Tax=Rhizophagus irregularis (strain DAOM 181602 / DAOM 197198 / MUCL 43194) TaxID=747089 RepID=U9TGE3_RHIID|nr:7514_t:CDS:2 [Rhizophagus irregularis]
MVSEYSGILLDNNIIGVHDINTSDSSSQVTGLASSSQIRYIRYEATMYERIY